MATGSPVTVRRMDSQKQLPWWTVGFELIGIAIMACGRSGHSRDPAPRRIDADAAFPDFAAAGISVRIGGGWEVRRQPRARYDGPMNIHAEAGRVAVRPIHES